MSTQDEQPMPGSPQEPIISQAEQLRDNPTQEIDDIGSELVELSKLSKSTARKDLHQEDGSVLVISSHNGDEVQYEIYKNVEEVR